MFRVAALQLASSDDVDQNLATCLRMIDQAAEKYRPELMVLPEFCNHISWYEDREHALRVAVTLDGPFLSAIAQRADKHRAIIVINCSLRREDDRITVTSLMYGPDGQLVSQADKQTLMGHENLWFERAAKTAAVLETPKARIGLYPCRDGVTMETPRCLALRGVQVMCNSLNSFALDEASLHVPARAAENRVFVVAANKVGPLLPASLLASVAEATFIPESFLVGAGESQIVAPDGSVLGKAERTGEAVVCVDIEPSLADNKVRPDGTHLFDLRRPELYRAIGMKPRPQLIEPTADTLDVAVVSIVDASSVDAAVASGAEQVQALAQAGAELIVLPELFCFEQGRVDDVEGAGLVFLQAVRALSGACAGTRAQVVTSLVERTQGDTFHMGVLIGQAGIVARQPQLHIPRRHAWARPGRRLDTFRLPWGKLCILVGEDMIVPELAKVAALSSAHLLASPSDLAEPWELLGLRSRAAENRVCIAMATRPSGSGTSALLDLEREFTIMQPWKERRFDGRINDPLVSHASADQGILRGTLHPSAANNKVMSQDTHLLDKRPWWLVSDLLQSRPRPSSEPVSAEHAISDTEVGEPLQAAAVDSLEQAGEGEGEIQA